MQGRHGLAALAMLLLTTALPGGSAYAADRLDGAWTTSAASCDEVFVKRKGNLALKRTSEGWSAFIVRGNRINGANATCSVKSSRQKGDVTTLLLDCADKIIFDTMTVSIRFKEDGTLVRFDPEFPEVETSYHRCDR